jgi:hypothetical protein
MLAVPDPIPYHSATVTTMTHSSAAFFVPGSFRRCSQSHRKCSNVRLPKTSSSLFLSTNIDPSSSLDAGTYCTDASRCIHVCVPYCFSRYITSSALTSSTYNPVVFEPILNVPALGTFLFVMVIFGLLQIRTNQVEKAVQERNLALKELREAKSKELSSGGAAQVVNVQQSLERFDKAMEKEERLRTIIPGVRIVPPSNGNKAEEDARVAARQFLNKDVAIGSGSSASSSSSKQEEGDGRLSMAAVGVLTLLAASLVALLVFLSLDPMTSNNVLDNLGGNSNNFI